MGDPITAAIIGAISARKQRKDVEKATKARAAAASKLKKEEELRETQAASRIKKRRGAAKAGALGPRATILTSPLGVTGAGAAPGAQKTLLGL